MFFFFSHHLSARYCKYCVDIMRKKICLSYGSKRVKRVSQNLSLNFFLVSHFQSVSILSILNCSCLFFHTFFSIQWSYFFIQSFYFVDSLILTRNLLIVEKYLT